MYVYYTCRTYLKQGKTSCPGTRVQVEKFQDRVLEEVLDWAFSVENVKEVVTAVRKSLIEREQPTKEIRERLEEIETRLARYYEAFETGAMEPEVVNERIRGLKREQEDAEAELVARTTVTDLPAHLTRPDTLAKIQQSIRDTIISGSPDLKKHYLKLLLDSVVYSKERVEITAKSAGVVGMLEADVEPSARGVAAVRSSIQKWQPVGDLNPCDGTENPAS